LPLPEDAPLIVSQGESLVAVHAQPVAADTGATPVKPDAPTLADVGENVGTHGNPAWVTVKVLPATVSVPVRGVLVVFAATL